MKKILLILAAFASCSVFSQRENHYGLKGGLNIATVTSDDPEQEFESKSVVRPFIGGYFEKHLSENSALTIEGQVSFQGGKLSLIERGEELESYTENITQLNVPVSYNYFFTPQLSVHGGGYLGLVLSAKEKDNRTGRTYDMSNKTLDFGLLAGISYALSEAFSAQLRYNFGVSDIESKQREKWMNRFFQIGIMYQLK